MSLRCYFAQLTFSIFQAITDEGIEGLCQGCCELISVNLSDITNLRDTSLRAFSQYCTKLQTLQVAHCSQLTDGGFSTLAQVSNSGTFIYCALQALKLNCLNDLK